MRYHYTRIVFLLCSILVFLAMAGRAGAQVNIGDSCFTLNWKYFPPLTDSTTWNPDSILVDTCMPAPCQCPAPHSAAWIKFGYQIEFDTNAIQLRWGPSGSDVEVTWQAIDTSYPILRAEFDSLEQRFGTYTLKKQYPNDTGSIEYGARDFYLILSNYVPYDSITAALDSISGIEAYFEWPTPLIGVQTTKQLSNGFEIFPNPAGNAIQIYCNGNTFGGEIQIVNPLGIAVKTVAIPDESTSATIEIGDLQSGYYYLICNGNFLPFAHFK